MLFSNVCSKGDYDGAITQYKLTIGSLEPSYVIRKVGGALYSIIDYPSCSSSVFRCSEDP